MLALQNLTKWYRTPRGRSVVFQDLDFRFPDGANIGLVGRNGSGKSTLLRLIGGIDQPNRGRVVSDLRISWPVGLSGGFAGTLTARENVQFIARVHGATGAEMRRVVDFVADFAEIGRYFDLPVASYSSGMRSRVAFGTSMAFDFDYYLIDEVMAVGDPQFRKKSREVLDERLKRSKVILVSHSVRDIAELCDCVVLVDQGNTVLYDSVDEGIAAYLQGDADRLEKFRRERALDGKAGVESLSEPEQRLVRRAERLREHVARLREHVARQREHVARLREHVARQREQIERLRARLGRPAGPTPPPKP